MINNRFNVVYQYSDMLIAFWDGTSKGTKHMIDLANKRGIKVEIVRY